MKILDPRELDNLPGLDLKPHHVEYYYDRVLRLYTITVRSKSNFICGPAEYEPTANLAVATAKAHGLPVDRI